MKNAVILLADGFEEIEALTIHDMLIRTHASSVKLVSIMKRKEVATSSGLHLLSDALLEEIEPNDVDFVILPGGKLGVDNIKNSLAAMTFIKGTIQEKKNIHAICAAPSILGSIGYLDNKKYTCYPGFQTGSGKWIDTGAVRDGNCVTGHSMGYSYEFAKEVIRYEFGEETWTTIEKGMLGN